jgi:hypothetical protein
MSMGNEQWGTMVHNRFHNQLHEIQTLQLFDHTCGLNVWMYLQKFEKLKTFPFCITIKEWGTKNLNYGKQ